MSLCETTVILPPFPLDPAQNNATYDFKQLSHSFDDFCRKVKAGKHTFTKQALRLPFGMIL